MFRVISIIKYVLFLYIVFSIFNERLMLILNVHRGLEFCALYYDIEIV